jgi:hypothetical protein
MKVREEGKKFCERRESHLISGGKTSFNVCVHAVNQIKDAGCWEVVKREWRKSFLFA